MPALTLKNIPADLYESLKTSARYNHRSLNSEVLHCLDVVLRSNKIEVDEFISEVRNFRKNITAPLLTDEFLKSAKEMGRK
jgi:hypothetical protein